MTPAHQLIAQSMHRREQPTFTANMFQLYKLVYSFNLFAESLATAQLKKSPLYSPYIEIAIDNYEKNYLKKHGAVSGDREADKQLADISAMAERILFALLEIDLKQPETVRNRFGRDLEALFIRYGVNMREMEKL